MNTAQKAAARLGLRILRASWGPLFQELGRSAERSEDLHNACDALDRAIESLERAVNRAAI